MSIHTYPVTPVTHLRAELDTERAMSSDMRKAVAEAVGYFKSEDGSIITEWIEDRLCINSGITTEYFRYDHVKKLRAERDAAFAEVDTLRAELGQCISENNQLTENAAELGKALDLALAERDAAFAEVDALRAELDAMRRAHSVIAARMEAMGC